MLKHAPRALGANKTPHQARAEGAQKSATNLIPTQGLTVVHGEMGMDCANYPNWGRLGGAAESG